jgi:hypothetical protein
MLARLLMLKSVITRDLNRSNVQGRTLLSRVTHSEKSARNHSVCLKRDLYDKLSSFHCRGHVAGIALWPRPGFAACLPHS